VPHFSSPPSRKGAAAPLPTSRRASRRRPAHPRAPLLPSRLAALAISARHPPTRRPSPCRPAACAMLLRLRVQLVRARAACARAACARANDCGVLARQDARSTTPSSRDLGETPPCLRTPAALPSSAAGRPPPSSRRTPVVLPSAASRHLRRSTALTHRERERERREEEKCDNPPRKIPYYRLRPIHFGH
jgi:hypothetical protein